MTAIRNNQFFEVTKEFITYAMKILKDDIDNEFQKIKNERPTDWLGAFSYDLQHSSRIMAPFNYVVRNRTKLQQCPKFGECEKIMQKDSLISKHVGVDIPDLQPNKDRVNSWEYLSHILPFWRKITYFGRINFYKKWTNH